MLNKIMADAKTSFHNVCVWSFNDGSRPFHSKIRPEWSNLTTIDKIDIIANEIVTRIPKYIQLGVEMHYNAEVDMFPGSPNNAATVCQALLDKGLFLGMITPGAHGICDFGGASSMDADERALVGKLGTETVDAAYGPLKAAWHPDIVPTLVLWNGSYGYDVSTKFLKTMYENLQQSIYELAVYEQKAGGNLYMAFEPKPNEGHPNMMIPTVSDALLFWQGLNNKYGLNIDKMGVNQEFGHSEMIGLDHVYDMMIQMVFNKLVHIHLNSQGYNDGLIGGGPARYDIDNGVRINGFNIAIAGMMQDYGYARWKAHDMQARPYDNTHQATIRIVRSILSWEACEKAAKTIDYARLEGYLKSRDTAEAEDMMGDAVVTARGFFNEMKKDGGL